MKTKRFSVEQIVSVSKQAGLGMTVADLTHQVGISEQALYRWKKLCSGRSRACRCLKEFHRHRRKRVGKLIYFVPSTRALQQIRDADVSSD
jgi:putative transposase